MNAKKIITIYLLGTLYISRPEDESGLDYLIIGKFHETELPADIVVYKIPKWVDEIPLYRTSYRKPSAS